MPDSQHAAVDHKTLANAIRALAMDAVQRANSGHPGMPMGMADVATVLFGKFLNFDPDWPDWPDRDRFVLSAGHGSMLLYGLLYLLGYARPTLDEIKNFRQLGSPCAGHPEFGEMPGIETTTGPLGQGLAMAVGMAMAERLEAARSGLEVSDHYTYVIAGDGCLMEGISHEAISLAGHLKLSKLIVLFDDNSISIDGPTDLAVSDDQTQRFAAHGWHVQAIDGHDPEAIAAAITAAQGANRPSMIACRTVIGYGAPNKQGTASTHGAPLGEEEIAAARAELGWKAPPFEVPEPVLSEWRAFGARGQAKSAAWKERVAALPEAVRSDHERRLAGDLPADFPAAIADLKRQLAAEPQKVATRKASQIALEAINPVVQETIGGSADLTGSNNTKTATTAVITPEDFSGRYVHYGVREFAMCAAMNGMALHGGFIPYGGTFLVFTDYARPAIRLSAMMRQRVIFVMTHDSIGLGEDGPTHQPIEHLASLRAMPNLNVFRPADVVETLECWQLALQSKDTPSVLALTRQGLPQLRLDHTDDNLCARGGYEISACAGDPEITLIATGSEVHVAMAAQTLLDEEGIACNVVSMPSAELFDAQPVVYRNAVLQPNVIKVAVEAASPMGWHRYVGPDGVVIGMRGFGASAPAGDLFTHFGITAEAVARAAKERL